MAEVATLSMDIVTMNVDGETDNEIIHRVREQFGPAAGDYTRSDVHSDAAALAQIVKLANPQPSDIVLDVATGAGHVALAFAPHVNKAVAFDLTEEMLIETHRNALARGLCNVETQQGRAEQLPFPDASFDIVTVRQAPHHFVDIESAVREMARVARADARIVIVDSYAPADEILDRQWNHMEKLRDPSHVRNRTAAEWRDLVSKADLQIVFEELGHCTANGRLMRFSDWVRRMKTAAAAVAELRRLFSDASPELGGALRVQTDGDDILFCVPQMTIVARRQAHS